MKVMLIFLILRCLVVTANINTVRSVNKLAYVTTNLSSVQKWTPLDKLSNLSAVMNRFRGLDIHDLLNEALFDRNIQLFPNVSLECRNAAVALISQINISNPAQMMTLPVTKMLDAWAKIPSRILLGHFAWLGAYEECSAIPQAKYCKSYILPNGTATPRGMFGSCFPRQCTNMDVNIVMNSLSTLTKGFLTTRSVCENPVVSYSTGAIITLAIISAILLLCLLGTLVETVLEYNKGKRRTEKSCSNESGFDNGALKRNEEVVDPSGTPLRYLPPTTTERAASVAPVTERHMSLAPVIQPGGRENTNTLANLMTSFSLLRNTRAILSTRVPKGAITSINGIRVISMTWIILGHYFEFRVMLSQPDNVADAVKIINRFSFLAVGNAYVSVDSFFVLSGLLVSYITLRKAGQKGIGFRDIPMMYLHRYIRLTPTLVVVILFWTNVYTLLLKGPRALGVISNRISAPCEKYWWSTLLYFNNFYPAYKDECVSWTWYLANDFQFYVVSPFILLLIVLIQKIAPSPIKAILYNLIAIAVMCFASMLTTGIITGHFDITSLMVTAGVPGNPRAKQNGMAMDTLYVKPYVRITPYLVGMFLGYLISKDATLDRKRGKLISAIGWITAIVLALLVVYGPWKEYKVPASFFTDAENIMYSACHRFVWACAVAWVIYACHNKYGGWVNAFLSWRVWIPLSRLTYSVYLLHLCVLIYYSAVLEGSYHYQDSFMVSGFISLTVLAYAFAFILTVCVEYPVMNLEKILFKR